MDILKKYTPNHYSNYLDNVNEYFDSKQKGDYNIHNWIKKQSKRKIDSLRRSLRYIYMDSDQFFEESSIIITLIIRLFIIELELEDDSISLTNNEIKKLIHRFDRIVKNEQSIRRRY